MHQKLTERTISGLHEFLIAHLPMIDPTTPILDIGCGTGAWIERLANLGYSHLHGLDWKTDQFGATKAKFSQVHLDYDDWGLGNQKFGLITGIEIIEHLENPGQVFQQVQHYLDPNGYFLLTTPNIHSLFCRLKFLIKGTMDPFTERSDPTHIYPVLIEAMQRLLERHHLHIVKQWSFPMKGSLIYRPVTQWVCKPLKLIFLDTIPGDTLCLLIRKAR
jgi:2-polyprenyl-3-methyl-5-hydroxy-6-metoxy-1,4-benzoquinol methylase